MEFEFKNIKSDLLSPADIFWQKKSGTNILVARKGDVLNLPLLQKLSDAGEILKPTNEIDLYAQHEMNVLYEKYSAEVLMRDKVSWRTQILKCLETEFVEKDKSQFELNYLGWKFFSTISYAEGVSFVERDSEMFKRHLTVATSYTFCAFLLGYYEPSFLSRLFSQTLKNLMELGNGALVMSLKEKLEYLRLQETFQVEDLDCVKEIASKEVLAKTVMFEKYDGSGIRNINSREMSDLDIVYVAINASFGFREAEKNIFSIITKGELKCEKRVLKMLQRVIEKKAVEIEPAA